MRVFITGGTGFIGRYVLEELKRRKHRVLALSRAIKKEHDVSFVKGDLAHITRWGKQLKKFRPDVAIHLAWEGIPNFSYSQSAKNLNIGLGLFAILADAGCKKIIVAGTGFECGDRTGKIPNDIYVKPISVIAASKHALHIMGEALARERRMDFVWIRLFNPYGPGQRPGSLIPHIMRSIATRTPLRLKNSTAQGDFIYVGNVARAIVSVVSRGKGYATYNVGSGSLTAVRDIVKLVCKEMGAGKSYCGEFMRTARGKLRPAPYADIGKIQKEIGWHPTIGIREGIQKVVREFALDDISS